LNFSSFFAEVQRLHLTPRYTLELFGDIERMEQGTERIRHFMIEQEK